MMTAPESKKRKSDTIEESTSSCIPADINPLEYDSANNSKPTHSIYFADDYYEEIIDDSNYQYFNCAEEWLLNSENTDIPLKQFPLLAYCAVELALSDLKNLGGSFIFTSPNFDQHCIDMLLKDSAFLDIQSTGICFGSDRKLNDVIYILSRLNLAGVDPIYLISPIVEGDNVVSLMITDLKRRKVWSFEPNNLSSMSQSFEDELKDHKEDLLKNIYQETSLYTTYFMANYMIYKFEPRTRTFNHSKRFKNNRFTITKYLPKNALSQSNFVLLMVIQLLIEESKGFNRLRDGDLVMENIVDVFKTNERRDDLKNFYLDMLEAYNNCRKLPNRTVNKNSKIKFFYEVTNESFCPKKHKKSTKLFLNINQMPSTSAVIFPPVEFKPNQLANKGFVIFKKVEARPLTIAPLLPTISTSTEEVSSKPLVEDDDGDDEDEKSRQLMLTDKLEPSYCRFSNKKLACIAASLLSFEVDKIKTAIRNTETSIATWGKQRPSFVPYLNAFDRIVLENFTDSRYMRTTFINEMENWLNLDSKVTRLLSKKRYNLLRGHFNRFTISKRTNGDILVQESGKVLLSLENQIRVYIRINEKTSGNKLLLKDTFKTVVQAYKVEHGYKILANFNMELVEHINKTVGNISMSDVSEDDYKVEENNNRSINTKSSCEDSVKSGSETSEIDVDQKEVLNEDNSSRAEN